MAQANDEMSRHLAEVRSVMDRRRAVLFVGGAIHGEIKVFNDPPATYNVPVRESLRSPMFSQQEYRLQRIEADRVIREVGVRNRKPIVKFR